MAKRWKRDEITYLKRYALRRTLDELAIRFKTDEETVEAQLVELGLAARGSDRARYFEDPSVAALEKAVQALHSGKKDQARKNLEVALQSELPEVSGKARLYLKKLDVSSGSSHVDPYLQALMEKNSGDFDSALAAAKRAGRWDKEGRFAYLGAAALVGLEELEAAEARLQIAIDLAPEFGIQARVDPDFAVFFEDEAEDEQSEDEQVEDEQAESQEEATA